MPETDDVIEITDAPTETHPENAPVADGLPVEVEFVHEEDLIDFAEPILEETAVQDESTVSIVSQFSSDSNELTLSFDNGTIRKATFGEKEEYLNFLYVNNQVEYTKVMATGYSVAPVAYPFGDKPEVAIS